MFWRWSESLWVFNFLIVITSWAIGAWRMDKPKEPHEAKSQSTSSTKSSCWEFFSLPEHFKCRWVIPVICDFEFFELIWPKLWKKCFCQKNVSLLCPSCSDSKLSSYWLEQVFWYYMFCHHLIAIKSKIVL